MAQQMVDVLLQAGVERIYGVVGDSLHSVVDAVRRTDGIEWVHVRNEETAAFAAAAEAQLTGRFAVCAGSCDQGHRSRAHGHRRRPAGDHSVRPEATAVPVPLLDVRLFTVRYFRGAVITDLPAILAMAGALPALTQHLQLVLGLSPLRTSFWLMPQAILAAAAAFVGAALVKRHPPAHVITGGLLTTATGFGLAVFPADLLDRASSTLAEALIVAGEVGGGTGSLLLAAAKEAFSEAATVTGIAGAGVMVVAAIWALVTLRGVSANLDLAEEHARQLH